VKFFSISLALVIGATVLDARQLGGKPAAIESPYKTEHAWAVGETAADIAEIAAASRRMPPAFTVPAGVKPWNPQLFVTFAREQFGPEPSKPATEPALADQYVPLANLTAVAVARASIAVSTALQQNLRSARAHESAALVLGAFGLREAADDLSDVRWVLNRMTAHLAIADALRPVDGAMSVDGQLASVAFLGLANRSATALKALDGVPDRPPDAPLMAWKRALRMRLTHDWRVSHAPASALRIEKLEYFRARRKTLSTIRGGEEMSRLLEPAAVDFARIVQSFSHGVEDGNTIVEPAIAGELLEWSEIYRLMHGRDLPAALPSDIMNVRAGRAMSRGEATVVRWGAWAEFFQRHAGMYAGEIDDHYRKSLGLHSAADDIKRKVDALIGHLTLFPVATARRTRGPGTEADLTHINAAIALTIRAPELVNYDFWRFLSRGSSYEVVKQAMPDPSKWFVPPSAEVPYDAGLRAAELLARLPMPQVEALVAEASADVSLAAHALRPRPGYLPMARRIVAWLKARGGYDLYAINTAVRWADTLTERIEWRRQGCRLAISQCLSLARLLILAGDEAGAVQEYERAFRDPALDQVSLSNNSAWMVSYYERSGHLVRAEDLAQRSGRVGSEAGLQTLGAFYERRARLDEAAAVFERIAGRYRKASAPLAGFLYRQAVVAKNPRFVGRWQVVERELFPGGLQPLPEAMPAQPANAVWVDDITSAERRLRVQVGDLIVGVDGWKVENREQYDAVIAFTESHAIRKITLWRGMLFSVELPADNGMELQSYPLRGWIQY
jgi:hypothetical protein